MRHQRWKESVKALVRLVPLWVMVLVGLGCELNEQGAGKGYKIVNPGIKDPSGGCWYDNTQFILVKRYIPPGTKEFEVEGLFVINPGKPEEFKKFDLAPIEENLQRKIFSVSCQKKTVLFYTSGLGKNLSRLYALEIDQPPDLIVEMRGGVVSLDGRYVLGKFRKEVMTSGEFSGTGYFEGHKDCGVAYAKPDFRVLCRENWMEKALPLPKFLFVEYRWEESIRVEETQGEKKWVRNPEPPLTLADGREIKHGFFLRDLENHIVQQIPMEQEPYRMRAIYMVTDPQGEFLYTSCFKTGDHDPRYVNSGRACRYKLDGNNNSWEEVFSPQTEPNDTYDLQGLDVNVLGDIVAVDMGHTLNRTLWKYTAATKTLTKVVAKQEKIGGPKLSPDGKTISFHYRGELYLAFAK